MCIMPALILLTSMHRLQHNGVKYVLKELILEPLQNTVSPKKSFHLLLTGWWSGLALEWTFKIILLVRSGVPT